MPEAEIKLPEGYDWTEMNDGGIFRLAKFFDEDGERSFDSRGILAKVVKNRNSAVITVFQASGGIGKIFDVPLSDKGIEAGVEELTMELLRKLTLEAISQVRGELFDEKLLGGDIPRADGSSYSVGGFSNPASNQT